MPKDDLAPKGDRLIIPASWRVVGPDAETPGAQGVILDAADDINAFLHHQRQAVRTNIHEQHRAQYWSPSIDVDYHNNQGEERITLTPRVSYHSSGQETTETNLETLQQLEYYLTHICMLVLYQRKNPNTGRIGYYFAAIPMGGLNIKPPVLTPIYIGQNANGSFTQPVNTGQYTFGKNSFIITDVDLSGKGLQKSTICTALIFDAISLGAQVVPMANSDTAVSTVVSPGSKINVYTPAASVSYGDGQFTLTQKNTNIVQTQAIDKDGTLYYGAEWTSDNSLVSLHTDSGDLDQSISDPAVAAATEVDSTFVPFYDLGYTYIQDDKRTASYDATQQATTYNTSVPDTNNPGSFVRYTVYIGTSDVRTSDVDNIELTVVSKVIPNTDDPKHINLNNITEILGSSYCGQATYSSPPTVMNVKQATVNTPYYEWNQSTLFYENVQVQFSQDDYSNSLYRMFYDVGGKNGCMTDTVKAIATSTQTIHTLNQTVYPGWGGNAIDGQTSVDDPTTYNDTSSDFATFKIAHAGNTTMQLVAHSTDSPSAIIGTYPYSYTDAKAMAEDCKQQLFKPAPGPNGGPGPVSSYSGSVGVSTSGGSYGSNYANHQTTGVDQFSGRYYAVDHYVPLTTINTTSGDIPPGPGYKGQVISATYDSSLSLFNQSVTGNIAALAQTNGGYDEQLQSSGQIIFSVFPPGTKSTGYAQFVTSDKQGVMSCKTVTPYGSLTNNMRTGNELTGWMHITDINLVLQGFLIGKTPYIYLQNQDITAALATALSCKTTDIAACYFDINLDTIKLLANVK